MGTDLAMALMRIRREEKIEAPETDLLEEFRDLAVFPKSMKIVDDLITWTPAELPEAERDYMIINICLILDGQNDA
jgi:hypothetical protein